MLSRLAPPKSPLVCEYAKAPAELWWWWLLPLSLLFLCDDDEEEEEEEAAEPMPGVSTFLPIGPAAKETFDPKVKLPTRENVSTACSSLSTKTKSVSSTPS